MLTTQQVEEAKERLTSTVSDFLDNALPKALEIWRSELLAKQGISTAGDCLYCQGLVTDVHGETFTGTEHLWSHMRENYIPAALMIKATKSIHADPTEVLHHIIARRTDVIRAGLSSYLSTALAYAPGDSDEIVESPEKWVEQATAALERPEDFGYFGHDETLFVSSALTWSRHRDSESIELANFEIVERTLVETFPHLVTVDAEQHLDDYDEAKGYPQIYIFRAGHWAVGWVEQIVVPVLADPAKPLSVTNLHPAYRLICELAEQVMAYPYLDGAEERADEMDRKAKLDDIERTLEWLVNNGTLDSGVVDHPYPLPSFADVLEWCETEDDNADEYAWESAQVIKAVCAMAEEEAYTQAAEEIDTNQLTLED